MAGRVGLVAVCLLAQPVRTEPPTGTAAPIYVSMQWCPDGACRTGHLMMNIISSICLAELFGWKYWHNPPANMKPSLRRHDETGTLFDFRNSTGPRGRVFNLPALSTRNDPAVMLDLNTYKDEKWGGHVSWEKVLGVSKGGAAACNAAVKKGYAACHLQLQYSWRVSLRRVYVWAREGKVDGAVPWRIADTLLKMACSRLEVNPTTRAVVTKGFAPDEPVHVSTHIRRGDRDAMWLGHNKRHGQWHELGDILNTTAGLDDALSRCGVDRRVFHFHTEPTHNEDITRHRFVDAPPHVAYHVESKNSLQVDFSLMLASDVFVGAPSSLSYVIDDLRFALGKTNVYNAHHREVCAPIRSQYPADHLADYIEPFEMRWNETRFLDEPLDCARLFFHREDRGRGVCAVAPDLRPLIVVHGATTAALLQQGPSPRPDARHQSRGPLAFSSSSSRDATAAEGVATLAASPPVDAPMATTTTMSSSSEAAPGVASTSEKPPAKAPVVPPAFQQSQTLPDWSAPLPKNVHFT